MTIEILLVILGLALVVGGANFVVDGASSLARKWGVSEFVIGLTIVGFGTSLPELVVSVTGALEGNSDVAIGNVIGSNIFNSLFILAVSALFVPMVITRHNKFRDIPIMLLVTFLLIILGMNKTLLGLGHVNALSRIEGAVMILLFIAYMVYCFKTDKDNMLPPAPEDAQEEVKIYPVYQAVGLTVLGLLALIFGGKLFVNHSVNIARALNVSDKFIAITLLAMGTSLPELVTSIVALAKHKGQMALGNIIGSNVFNILLILGVSALICPMSFASVNLVDIGALALSAILIWTSVYTGKKNLLDRFDACIMLIVFIAYMVWLFMKM